jgi:hypothetical protein
MEQKPGKVKDTENTKESVKSLLKKLDVSTDSKYMTTNENKTDSEISDEIIDDISMQEVIEATEMEQTPDEGKYTNNTKELVESPPEKLEVDSKYINQILAVAGNVQNNEFSFAAKASKRKQENIVISDDEEDSHKRTAKRPTSSIGKKYINEAEDASIMYIDMDASTTSTASSDISSNMSSIIDELEEIEPVESKRQLKLEDRLLKIEGVKEEWFHAGQYLTNMENRQSKTVKKEETKNVLPDIMHLEPIDLEEFSDTEMSPISSSYEQCECEFKEMPRIKKVKPTGLRCAAKRCGKFFHCQSALMHHNNHDHSWDIL